MEAAASLTSARLADGVDLHLRRCQGPGLLPGDLIGQIHALRQRPIPWDVALGRWLDGFLPTPAGARLPFVTRAPRFTFETEVRTR